MVVAGSADERAACQPLTDLCSALGLPLAVVDAPSELLAAVEAAADGYNGLILLLPARGSLVLRPPAAVAAAYAAAVRQPASIAAFAAAHKLVLSPRPYVLTPALPSFGWLGDAAADLAARDALLEATPPVPCFGGATLTARHIDGGCLLGPAPAVAALLRYLSRRAPRLPLATAVARYAHTWCRGADTADLPLVVADGTRTALAATLDAASEAAASRSGGVTLRDGGVRPCVLRAPHGGSLARVQAALGIDAEARSVPIGGGGGGGGNETENREGAAVWAALGAAWRAHTHALVIAACVLALLCASIVAATRAASRARAAARTRQLYAVAAAAAAAGAYAPGAYAHAPAAAAAPYAPPPYALPPTYATHVYAPYYHT